MDTPLLDTPLLLPLVTSPPPTLNNENNISAKTKEVGCQIEKEMQLMEEIRLLHTTPEFLPKVFAYVTTLSPEKQRRFYQMMGEYTKRDV